MNNITPEDKALFGIAGGQLEYVSQRVEWQIMANGRWRPYMIIRFTDHDVQSVRDLDLPNNGLIDGLYYELSFPMSSF